MARIRTIKPEFWTSEQIVECSRDARLLFIGLLNFCDDNGVHPASARRLKMEVYPGEDDLKTEDIRSLTAELIKAGLVREYIVGGETYWHVTGWRRHQKIDKPTIRHPAPEKASEFAEPSSNDSTSTRRALDDSSTTEGKGREMEGIVEEGMGSHTDRTHSEAPTDTNRHAYEPEFLEAWNAYPKRSGANPKRRAARAWAARRREGVSAETMYQGTLRYAAYVVATKQDATQYVKQAATFFGPDRDYDESWEISSEATKRHRSDAGPRLSAVERVERANRTGQYAEPGPGIVIDGSTDS